MQRSDFIFFAPNLSEMSSGLPLMARQILKPGLPMLPKYFSFGSARPLTKNGQRTMSLQPSDQKLLREES